MILIIFAVGGLLGAAIYLSAHRKKKLLSEKIILFSYSMVIGCFCFLVGMLISLFSCSIFAYFPSIERTTDIDFEQGLILSQAGTAVSLTDNWFEYYSEEGRIKVDIRMTYIEYTEEEPYVVRYTVRPSNKIIRWLFNPHYSYYIFYVPEGGVALPRSPY